MTANTRYLLYQVTKVGRVGLCMLAVLLVQSSGVEAEDEEDEEEESFNLDPFVVGAESIKGYMVTNVLTASKIGLPLKEVPLNT